MGVEDPVVIDGVAEPDPEALRAKVEQGRADWLALVDRAGERVLEAGASGDWNLRDVVAHINAYQRFLVGELGGTVRPFGDMGDDTGDFQKRNEIMHAQDLDLPWEFLTAEAANLHTELLRLLDGWNHADLRQQFAPWHPWPRWRWIVSLTAGHYEEHSPNLTTWLEGR